jgi:hypothetical protein
MYNDIIDYDMLTKGTKYKDTIGASLLAISASSSLKGGTGMDNI